MHGYREGDTVFWDTKIGRGRPSWNVQDPSMVVAYFDETMSIYCGGIDNLYRHHDYAIAILESVRPYRMARYWLHGRHLLVDGLKMSKSKGNIVYVEDLLSRGHSAAEARFFLIYGHYGKRQNFSYEKMEATAVKLRNLRGAVTAIKKRAGRAAPVEGATSGLIVKGFSDNMDNDLHVNGAFDGIERIVMGIDAAALKPEEAAGILKTLKEIDSVLKVVF